MRRLLLGLAIASIAALSPCWVHADDQQIAQQIVQQLRQQKADGRLTGFGIDLEVESGIVWLKGHVTPPSNSSWCWRSPAAWTAWGRWSTISK